MDETTTARAWPDSIFAGCSDMLTVADTARMLNLEERAIRYLLTVTNPTLQLPGVKIGKSWRIPRDELRSYLLHHHKHADRNRTPVIGTP